MLSRRNFFASLAGVVAWTKSGFSLSPAASAIQPTCSILSNWPMDVFGPDGVFKGTVTVTEIDERNNTIWLESTPNNAQKGDVIMFSRASDGSVL